jgi:peptidyl-tRNA hydrolase
LSLPVLYIIMRNDLASMNPGKAMAQASHASNAFVKDASVITDSGWKNFSTKSFENWKCSTNQGFGTVLVLAANIDQIRDIVYSASLSGGYLAEIIHDPTYPIVDGATVHHIPLDTCAYVFVPDKFDGGPHVDILSPYELHP